MKKQSKNKFINKALNELNLSWNCLEYDCDSIDSIKSFISYQKMLEQEQIDILETTKENIETINNNITNAENIINQTEIEEYKQLNPRAKNIYKL